MMEEMNCISLGTEWIIVPAHRPDDAYHSHRAGQLSVLQSSPGARENGCESGRNESKTFGRAPRHSLILGGRLLVAFGHIQTKHIASNTFHRRRIVGDILCSCSNDDG